MYGQVGVGNASYVVADYVLTPVILAEIENFVVEMVGMMVAYKKHHRKFRLMFQFFHDLVGRIMEVVEYNHGFIGHNHKAAVFKECYFHCSVRFYISIYNTQ